MDLGISGRVAMVAAASKGIGFAAAKRLVDEGVRVSICSRTEHSLKDAIEALGPAAVGSVCDVTNESDIERWFRQSNESLGQVDILVTNTGGPPAGKLDALTDAQWRQGFESTVLNIVRLVRIVTPSMIDSRWGRVVHVTSLVAFEPNPNLPISTTLRSGIRGLTRLQSDELAPHGITVNSVLPGHTKTDRQAHLAKLHNGTEEDYYRSVASSVPLRRMAEANEVGDAIAFLCSERASYISGVSLLVDGGMTRAF
ncbi:MAG: SDR family oxidoreductase [Fimbriimonadales bacterium]|nr:SDR family oxidoreductase [Fimbriimonadales bacterium]